MGRELFGTDGVRGLAGEYPLDDDGAIRIGRAVGKHFGQPGQRMLIASDPRGSSAGLVAKLTEGLVSMGINVTNVGILPTPGLAYLTRESDVAAGVMVTASHNPVEYNGVKVFDEHGGKLRDATEASLNKLITEGVEPAEKPGRADEDSELSKKYEAFLVAGGKAGGLKNLKLAVDSAHGAASGLAERVFSQLGAEVTALFDTPDGTNINDGCGASHPEALSQRVKTDGLDLGVGLDGDADRVVLVDAKGRLLNGDHVLYILALTNGLSGIVATTMTNLGVENALSDHGVEVKRCDVGDRYVLEALAKTGYELGGEQSGHVILPKLLKTGDGLLVAVQTILAVQASGRSLADWYDEVPMLPQALVNIKLTDKSKLESPAVQTFITEQASRLEGNGRLLIRPSGTEPLARVMVEAEDADKLAKEIADSLEELL